MIGIEWVRLYGRPGWHLLSDNGNQTFCGIIVGWGKIKAASHFTGVPKSNRKSGCQNVVIRRGRDNGKTRPRKHQAIGFASDADAGGDAKNRDCHRPGMVLELIEPVRQGNG